MSFNSIFWPQQYSFPQSLRKSQRIKGFEGQGIEWHFIGHLQRNKAKEAVTHFRMIHSIDSVRLAEAVNRWSERLSKPTDILIEVSVSGEESKFGISLDDCLEAVREISGFQWIRIKGLMTMAPFTSEPEETRPIFRGLKELAERIKSENIPGV